jgi:hypothetical protein
MSNNLSDSFAVDGFANGDFVIVLPNAFGSIKYYVGQIGVIKHVSLHTRQVKFVDGNKLTAFSHEIDKITLTKLDKILYNVE